MEAPFLIAVDCEKNLLKSNLYGIFVEDIEITI